MVAARYGIGRGRAKPGPGALYQARSGLFSPGRAWPHRSSPERIQEEHRITSKLCLVTLLRKAGLSDKRQLDATTVARLCQRAAPVRQRAACAGQLHCIPARPGDSAGEARQERMQSTHEVV